MCIIPCEPKKERESAREREKEGAPLSFLNSTVLSARHGGPQLCAWDYGRRGSGKRTHWPQFSLYTSGCQLSGVLWCGGHRNIPLSWNLWTKLRAAIVLERQAQIRARNSSRCITGIRFFFRFCLRALTLHNIHNTYMSLIHNIWDEFDVEWKSFFINSLCW